METGSFRKQALRRAISLRLAALSPEERRERDTQLAARARACALLTGLETGAWVFGYAAMADEPELSALWQWLTAGGRRLAFPRWLEHHDHGPGRSVMTFHEPPSPPPAPGSAPGAGWVRTRRGLWEPESGCPEVAPTAAGLVVVPGRAFAVGGGRLGRGRGCYDAWLTRLPPQCPTLALAYDEQIVDELPVDGHDLPVSAWLTPTRFWSR